MKLGVKFLFVACLVFMLSLFILSISTNVDCVTYADSIKFINNREDFLTEIQKGSKEIYVGDILSDKDTPIVLNYDIKIIGKSEKSTLTKFYFTINGSNLADERISVEFKNIILDGLVDKNGYNFSTPNQTFYQIFSNDRIDKRAIFSNVGYFDLNMSNCEINRYASYCGPAIEIDNTVAYRDGKINVNIEKTSFMNNISYDSTVKFGNDIGTYNFDYCVFKNNLSKETGGATLSNGKASLLNSKIIDNEFYYFAIQNENGEVDTSYQNDLITITATRVCNYVNTAGALYLGGSDAIVKNCIVENNESLFGGGIGATSPDTVKNNEQIIVENTIIANNKAKCGGGIYVRSKQGHYIRFINCNIYGNSAEEGAIIYATTTNPVANVFGGNIEFVFCSIVNNVDSDSTVKNVANHECSSFEFHRLAMARLSGFISFKGCFVLDQFSFIASNWQINEFSYIATKEQAILEGVVLEDSLTNISKEGIKPIKDSSGDIQIEEETYSTWAEIYNLDSKEIMSIGSNVIIVEPAVDPPLWPEPKAAKIDSFPYWVIVFPIAGIVIVVICLCVYKKKRIAKTNIFDDIEEQIDANKEVVEYSALNQEELEKKVKEIYSPYKLTRKEMEIAYLLLVCERRKDIAEKLFLSEDTVKSHIAHIYKKVHVSSKEEFRNLTNKKINK